MKIASSLFLCRFISLKLHKKIHFFSCCCFAFSLPPTSIENKIGLRLSCCGKYKCFNLFNLIKWVSFCFYCSKNTHVELQTQNKQEKKIFENILNPNTNCVIPAWWDECHAVRWHTNWCYSILVTAKWRVMLSSHRIPNVDVVIVRSAQQQSAAKWESY